MTRVAWRFTEPVSGDSYDLTVNPDKSTVTFAKNPLYSAVLADRSVVELLGMDSQPTLHLSGTITAEAELTALESWWDRETPIVVTDDLSQQFTVLFTKMSTPRVRTAFAPWHHTFTLDAICYFGILVPSDGLVPSDSLVPR